MANDQLELSHGRCLCGSVTFKTTGQPVIAAHCHCEDCQRITGAGHSTGAMFAEEQFEMTGKVASYVLESAAGNKVTRVFCPNCGSPILGKNTGMVGFVTVSLGLFEDSSKFSPAVAIFSRNRKPWDTVHESVTSFETQPEWSPK